MIDITDKIGETLQELFINKDGKFVKGFLVDINDTECEVWLPYSLEAMKLLSVGSLLAVPNFAGINVFASEEEKLLKEELHFSILQVKSKKAVHYTIESLKQNPATIELEKEFSKLVKDWERTLKDNESPNLKIIVKADLTEREILIPNIASLEKERVKVQLNQMEPVQGHEVYLLGDEMVEKVINTGVIGKETSMMLGQHKYYQNVNIYLDYEQLLRKHFGVFATTGAGKSNLLSNIVSALLDNDRLNTNVVIFDVNNEYTTLLIDQLVEVKDAHIIILEESYAGESLRNFLMGNLSVREEAAMELARTVVVPNSLKSHKDKLAFAIDYLLNSGKIKLYVEGYSVERLLHELHDFVAEEMKLAGRNAKQNRGALLKLIEILSSKLREETDTSSNLSIPLAEAIVVLIDEIANEAFGKELPKIKDKVDEIKKFILEVAERVSKFYLFSVGIEGIFKILNDDEKSLVILLADDDNTLRAFAYHLVKFMYEFRKSNGVIEPPVLFFFDEADLFIPRDAGTKNEREKETIKQSKEACMTLARRGRKYGLGLGVSTQRVAYNDTTIIAQLNTFFVSKLARKYDRKAIAEVYSVSEDLLAASGMFVPGDWLILSSSATGIKNAPITVHMPDAETRVRNFLDKKLEEAKGKLVRNISQLFEKMRKDENLFADLEEEEYRDIEPILYP